jgi:cellulose synthase/poly-beta-1,6-N-acetylglucosamine synthase-like glycosyltransferase/cytochrome b561
MTHQDIRLAGRSRFPVGTALFALVLIFWLAGLIGIWQLNGLARWSAGLLYVAYDTWLIFFVARELRGGAVSPPQLRDGAAAASPCLSIAVLISARNEARALPATLDALLAQDDPAEEIWVVDDGSQDDTRTVLAAYPQVQAITKTNSGKADSLNRGIELISSDLIITLDADTLLRADAVGEMRRRFTQEPELVAAGGVLTPRCGPGVSGRLFEWFQTFEYLRSFIARVAWMRAGALLLVSGAFACFRRDALQRVGGFDARSWVEDYELIHRLHRYAHDHSLTWRVRVLPGAAALTDAPGTLGAFMRQRRRWFGGFLQTLYRHRDMVGNPAYAAVGRLMLPIKVIDTLQPVFGITAFGLLLFFAVRGHAVLGPVLWVIGVKLIIDFAFLLWALEYYNRWSGRRSTARERLLAALAALTEPFCFQLMRHCGALLGWIAVLTRRVDWRPYRTATQRPSVRRAMSIVRDRYTTTALVLHWAIALLLAVNIALALSVDHLPDAAVRPVIDTHKSIGITILGLVLIRLLWRLSHKPPPLATRYARWERRIAGAVHLMLYGLMFALPLSGWLHDSAWKDAATHPMRLFGLVPFPRIQAIASLEPALKESLHTLFGQLHTWFGYALYALFLLHVLGALKHQLYDREPELQRMLPRRATQPPVNSG